MQKLVYKNANGEELDLTDGVKFGVTTWEGFSNCNLTVQTQTVPFADGSVYLDGLLGERELAITVAVNDNGDLGLRYQLKRELISMLNPKLGEGYLIYTNDYLSRRIKVVPYLPTFGNKNIDTAGTLKASCTFKACDPYWEDVEETEVVFGISEHPEIENVGDIAILPKIDFFATKVENPRIVNNTTGKFIQFGGVLDDSLFIETKIGEKKVETETLDLNLIKNSPDILKYFKSIDCFLGGMANGIIIRRDRQNKNVLLKTPISQDINDVSYSEELDIYIAVGDDGKIVVSKTLSEWEEVESGTSQNLNFIEYYNAKGYFLASGQNKTIIRSVDGINWEVVITAESDKTIDQIKYLESSDVFVGLYNNGIIYSTDGETWQGMAIGNQYNKVRDITLSQKLGIFVVVGWDARVGTIYTSTNGYNWIERTSGLNNQLAGVVFSNNLNMFIANARSGKIIASYNGIDWFVYTQIADTDLSRIAYSEELGYFSILSSNKKFISLNALNWSEEDFPESISINSVKFVNNKWILLGVGQIQISTDLKTFETKSLGVQVNLYDIIYVDEYAKYYIVGANGKIFITEDFETFGEADSTITDTPLLSIVYNDNVGRFVVVGGGAVPLRRVIIYSDDGTEWHSVVYSFLPNATVFSKVIYSQILQKYIAVGSSIITSEDGQNWEQIKSALYLLNDILEVNTEGQLITCGNNGEILISKDGTNWGRYMIDSSLFLLNLSFNPSDKRYYVRTVYKVYTSLDCIMWEDAELPFLGSLNSIINVKGVQFIFGNNNTYIYTPFYKLKENAIDNVTVKSNLDFEIVVGKNNFTINKTDGAFICHLTYRNRYVGV